MSLNEDIKFPSSGKSKLLRASVDVLIECSRKRDLADGITKVIRAAVTVGIILMGAGMCCMPDYVRKIVT